MSIHKTWWGEEFVQSLTTFIEDGRLSRGRSYGNDNRVISFDIKENIVTAKIRGNINPYFGVFKEPKYKVKLELKKISIKDWEQAITKISKHPGWLSKLMLNELPSDINIAFGKNSLLPEVVDDVTSSCNCPDYYDPCKHIAGVYYYIANMLDKAPLLLFSLRGMPLETLKQKLCKTDLGKAFSEHLSQKNDIKFTADKYQFTPIKSHKKITTTQYNYWCMPDIKLEKHCNNQQTSAVLIKKQGDYPEFWNKQKSFIAVMEEMYQYLQLKNKDKLL